MHIARLQLRGFKRFHDLSIEIPGTPQLVMMCGPNGTGKSSIIDGFRLWHGGHGSGDGWGLDDAYHRRTGEPAVDVGKMIELEFVEEGTGDPRRWIYARSAYRHEPDFQVSSLQRSGLVFDAPRSRRMIEQEAKVSDNYQRLISATLDELFGGEHDAETVAVLRDRHIGRIRDAMLELFPDLELQGPGDPIGGGTFYFRKNGASEFHYKNLSGGEKAAFDLLLDLVIKTAAYDDTVFCIDEPELHLNTRLQASLLTSLLKLMPETGQLWVASHSIGMMRRAQELYEEDPSQVVFLDFEDKEFDQAITLAPTKPDRGFWTRTLRIALGDLADLIAPDQVVLCEGRPAPGINVARAEFDARCYRKIFATEYPRTDFVSVGNASDVQQDRVELGRTIQTIVSGTRVLRVVDRDLRSPQEIQDLRDTGTRVLRRRHLESYLLDDEVIGALCEKVGQPEKTADVIQERETAIVASVQRGNDPDDVKSAAGEFYVAARQQLSLAGAGSTTEAFLADTMAELIAPSMAVYEELMEDLFGS